MATRPKLSRLSHHVYYLWLTHVIFACLSQLLALIRGTPTNPGLTLERMARCTLAIPSAWLAQSQDKRASPLLEQLQAISRVLQSSRHGAGNRSGLEARLSKLMSHARLIA